MDRFLRLTFGLFMLACIAALVAPRVAQAQAYEFIPMEQGSPAQQKVQDGSQFKVTWSGRVPATGDTQDEACNAFAAQFASAWGSCAYQSQYRNTGLGRWASPTNPGNCQIQWEGRGCDGASWSSSGYSLVGALSTVPKMVCPADTQEFGDGLCYPLTCPESDDSSRPWQPGPPADEGFCYRPVKCNGWAMTWSDGSCGCPVNAADRHQMFGAGTYSLSGDLAPFSTQCLGGCEVTIGGQVTNVKTSAGWETVFQVIGSTGDGCEPQVESQEEEQPPVEWQTCLTAGGFPGTVNGKFACLAAGQVDSKTYGKPVTKTETVTHPDGSQTITETKETPVQECVNGVCTTTISKTVRVITKDPQGNVTGDDETGTDTESSGGGDNLLEGFCKENPNSIICKQSTWGGSCGGFTCDGDAIQCAIAKEQHQRNCEFWESKGGLSREGAEEAFDEAREFDPTQLNAEPVEFGTGIGSGTFLGGGCIEDAQFNLWGGETLTIPFSSLCPYLAAAGNAFLAVCGLIAFAVVRRGMEA